MQLRNQLYIDGAWVASEGDQLIDVVHATTEEVIGRVADGTSGDVDRAAVAARMAKRRFPAQPKYSPIRYVLMSKRVCTAFQTASWTLSAPGAASITRQRAVSASAMLRNPWRSRSCMARFICS